MVFDSGITVWQVPSSVYPMVSVGYAELEEKIGGAGPLADYLIGQLHEWNATYHREPIESRSLGDSPAISLMLYPQGGTSGPCRRRGSAPRATTCPGSGHPIQVCESVDVRFLLEDMFAKIRRFGAGEARPLHSLAPKGLTTMTDLPIFGAGIWHFATYKDRYATEGYGEPVGLLEQIDQAGAVGDLSVVDLNWPFAGFDGTLDDVKAALARNNLRAIAITPEIYNRDYIKGSITNPDPARPRAGAGADATRRPSWPRSWAATT